MTRFSLDGCTALITGASAGLGREFARQLATRAGALVLVARREDRLQQLRDELTKRDPNLNVLVRATDLSDDTQVEELCRWVQSDKISVDLLINNAGLGDYGLVATSDPARLEEMIAVNIGSLTMLSHRLVRPMIQRRRGAVLNVSSSAGFLPIAGMAVYAATKAYVNSFSEALRMELRGTGVRVTTLCPGPVHTEFGEVAQRSGTSARTAPEVTYVSAERVVRAALRAVERDQPLVIPGLVMKLGMLLLRLTPMPLLRLTAPANQRG
jgi:short-subunit dehydrogenase